MDALVNSVVINRTYVANVDGADINITEIALDIQVIISERHINSIPYISYLDQQNFNLE